MFVVKTRLYHDHHAFLRVDKLSLMIYKPPEKDQPRMSCASNGKCAFVSWIERQWETIIDIYIYILQIKRKVSSNNTKLWGGADLTNTSQSQKAKQKETS